MANRTVKHATTVHGTDPQFLIEKIIRFRIYSSAYWKENCSHINSADILERGCNLRWIGGVYGGNTKPVPFICLVLKLLQLQPASEIIEFFVQQQEFKYLRALGAFYIRLVDKPANVYKKLEPYYKDYRKLRLMDRSQKFILVHMDEFIDQLLREDRVLDVILPRLTKRTVLEQNGDLELYRSELEEINLIPAQIIQEDIEEKKPNFSDKFKNEFHDSGISMSRDEVFRRTGFRKEEIDNENSIRIKLGIRLLKI